MPSDPIPHTRSDGAPHDPPSPTLSSNSRSLGVAGVGGLTVGMAGMGLDSREKGAAQPPKAGQLGKLRQGPRDTIPIVGKSPRKQRSSRFHVTEKVHLEKLPGFNGQSLPSPLPLNLAHPLLRPFHDEQKSDRKNEPTCSLGNSNNLPSSLTLTMLLPISPRNTSRLRLCMRCWIISHKAGGSFPRPFTPRWSRWYVHERIL
jgi:hypothetical protein